MPDFSGVEGRCLLRINVRRFGTGFPPPPLPLGVPFPTLLYVDIEIVKKRSGLFTPPLVPFVGAIPLSSLLFGLPMTLLPMIYPHVEGLAPTTL